VVGRRAEQPFQRLRLDFYLLEGGLLLGRSTIRRIPVTEIHPFPTLGACHTPVGNLVQRAAEVIAGEDDTVHRIFRVRRQVDGLGAPAHQPGVVAVGKAMFEQLNQILAIVLHWAGRQLTAN
jgi:hypothetical protein